MRRLLKFAFLLLIPLGYVVGLISENNHNKIELRAGMPTMSGSFSLYGYTFVGCYLGILLTALIFLLDSKLDKKAKNIAVLIAIVISTPVLILTSLFL